VPTSAVQIGPFQSSRAESVQLLTVTEVAALCALSVKTVRRRISSGVLPVHRLGTRTIRVDARSVTHLLTPSSESSLSVGEVRTMVAKPPGAGVRLYRTRGRGKTWTGLIGDEEVKLGTADPKEAEARLATLAEKRAKAAAQRRSWRVYKDDKGWFIKFYDDEGKRRTQRVPPSAGATTQSDAEAYARRQFLNEVKIEPTAAAPERPTPDTTFRQFGELWTSGTLAKLEPDYIAPKASSEDDRQRLELYLYPELGHLPMKHFQGKEGLALVKRVQREVAQTELAKSTRRQILQNANRLLNLAVHPFELIDVPLATLMEPPIFKMMEPGGGTQRPKEVVSRLRSGVERGQARARLRRRSSGLGLVTGAAGGGPSLSMLGLRRERYDSPSTTRS
jgi:excisionase family DNA binding protein